MGQGADIGVTYTSLEDQALVALLHRHDEEALAALYDRYGRLAFAVALRLLREHEKAEEVVQDAFVKLWRQPGAYTPERGRFQAWFLSVVHHRAVDALRATAREHTRLAGIGEAALVDILPDAAPLPEEQAIRRSEREAVLGALDELPAAQRTAIALAYFDGLSQSEIAARLGDPLGTVKTRVRTGMQRLRATLEAAGAGIGGMMGGSSQ